MKLGEKKCPQCAEAIKVDAAVCKHCGREFTDEEVAAAKAADRKARWSGGCGCLVLLFLAVGIVGMFVDESGEDNLTAGIADPKVAQVKAAEAGEDPKAGMERLIGEVRRIATTCDEASAAAGEKLIAFGTGEATIFDAYADTKNAKDICSSVSAELRELEAPSGLTDEQRSAVDASIGHCGDTYLIVQTAMGTALEVLDNQGRPSLVQKFQEEMGAVQTGQMLCVGGLVAVSGQVGGNAEGA